MLCAKNVVGGLQKWRSKNKWPSKRVAWKNGIAVPKNPAALATSVSHTIAYIALYGALRALLLLGLAAGAVLTRDRVI